MVEGAMKQKRQNGFVLIVVVVLIYLFGVMLFVLAGGARTMVSESITVTLEANNTNLLASGLAWAEGNKEKLCKQKEGSTFQLNVDDLGIRGASCIITVDEVKDDGADITIAVSCTKGRRKFERSRRLRLAG